jgi:hypothetical protein
MLPFEEEDFDPTVLYCFTHLQLYAGIFRLSRKSISQQHTHSSGRVHKLQTWLH